MCMILITKDGRKIRPVRMGIPESVTPTEIIKGVDITSDSYKSGKIISEDFRISDIVQFEGSYAFPPIII